MIIGLEQESGADLGTSMHVTHDWNRGVQPGALLQQFPDIQAFPSQIQRLPAKLHRAV